MTETSQPRSHHGIYLFFLANTPFHLVVVALWNVAWLAYCAWSNDWQWFMRSGAVTIVLGAVVSFRNVLRLTEEERVRFRNMTIIECFSESEKSNQEGDSVAVIYGVWIMIFGTAVAAYGDLIGRL
nr:hypothetical protein [uncultured Rhodoferax sp.]